MKHCAYVVLGSIIVVIILSLVLLSNLETKKASMTLENYYQQPYSDNDMRVSCFFENPASEGIKYCPPPSPESLVPVRRKRRRSRNANPEPSLPIAGTYLPEIRGHSSMEMSSLGSLPQHNL